jgi:flagellin
MALGVLNNLSAIYAENNLSKTSSSLQTVLQQLSSGSKINSGADDAAGLSLVNGLQANSQALVQSGTNATEGVGLLDVADGALSQVTNLLDRAVTLATEASNGTLNTSQLAAANQEYTSILSEINNIGTTTTYNQDQVFAGKTVAIYTGDASSQGSSMDNLYIRTLSESSVGDTGGAMAYNGGQNNVFIDLSKAGINAAVTDSLGLASASTTITVNYLTNGAGGTATPATKDITVGAGTSYQNTAQGLISAINGAGLGLSASFGTAAQAGTVAASAAAAFNTAIGGGTDTGIIISGSGVGTGTNGAGEVGTLAITGANNPLVGTLTIVGSDGKTHNITMDSSSTPTTLAATINGAGYGVTAALNAGNTALIFTSNSAAVSVSTSAGFTVAGTVTALTGTPTLDTPYSGTIGTITSGTYGSGTIQFGSNAAITLGTPASSGVTGTDNAVDLAATINAGNYGVTATLDSTGTILTFTSPNSADTVTFTNVVGSAQVLPVTDNSEYYSVGITSASGVTDTTTNGGGTANVGMVMDTNGVGGTATTSYSDNAGADLASTDLLSTTNAQSALGALNSAISDVAAMDGYIGAQINTLNSVGQVLTTQQENVTSAQNALQATDYASATSAMSKYEILSQTGIAALAQANTVQQEVTKLLQ